MNIKKRLDATKKPDFVKEFDTLLHNFIIGQDHAIEKVSSSLSKLYSGIRNTEKPILTLLFLGSTGVGKTEMVKILSNYFFGKRDAFTRVNCQEYSQEHNVSRLIGSPPGYIGREIEPALSQKNIDKHWREARRRRRAVFRNKTHRIHPSFPNPEEFLSIVLFDEVEKAHPTFWTSLLGVLDDGNIVMADNKEVNLRNSIIIMTSNVGSYDITEKKKKKSVGFDISFGEDNNIEKLAIESAKNEFPPEFLNRFDSIVVFNPLNVEAIKNIFEVEYKKTLDLIKKKIRLTITITEDAKKLIIENGYSNTMGARNLSRTISELITVPISNLITNEELKRNDKLEISVENNVLVFDKIEKIIRKQEQKIDKPKRVKARTAKS